MQFAAALARAALPADRDLNAFIPLRRWLQYLLRIPAPAMDRSPSATTTRPQAVPSARDPPKERTIRTSRSTSLALIIRMFTEISCNSSNFSSHSVLANRWRVVNSKSCRTCTGRGSNSFSLPSCVGRSKSQTRLPACAQNSLSRTYLAREGLQLCLRLFRG